MCFHFAPRVRLVGDRLRLVLMVRLFPFIDDDDVVVCEFDDGGGGKKIDLRLGSAIPIR
jgi:hypothetical protein